MKVQDILNDKGGSLITIGPEATVASAVALMVEKDISSLLVMDRGAMAGLITLREILRGLNERGAGLVTALARDIMTANPPVARPDDSETQLNVLMTEKHITHVPVMDEGALIGILSFQDIARSAIKDAAFENKLLKQYIKNWPE